MRNEDRGSAVRSGGRRPVLRRPERQALVDPRRLESRRISLAVFGRLAVGTRAGVAARFRPPPGPSGRPGRPEAAASADAGPGPARAFPWTGAGGAGRQGLPVSARRGRRADHADVARSRKRRRPTRGRSTKSTSVPTAWRWRLCRRQTRHVRVWETVSGRLLADLPVVEGVVQVAFAPTGRTLAVLTGGQCIVHELRGYEEQSFAALHAWPSWRVPWVGKEGGLACLAGDRVNRQGELSAMAECRPEGPGVALPVAFAHDPDAGPSGRRPGGKMAGLHRGRRSGGVPSGSSGASG